MKSPLDKLIAEARTELVPPKRTDDAFAALESRLMKEVKEEPRVVAAPKQSFRALHIGAAAIAAAVGFLVIGRHEQEPTPAAITMEPTAGSLRSTEGPGEVRISGVSAVPGQTLRAGDVVEAEGARAIFERPRKATWILENEHGIARAHVKSAQDPLVVALDEGSVEAQVTPVASGEAFAIDLPTAQKVVRVAVHGTHLRVTRTAEKVSIDLTEGVVSIGVPPRTGSTIGTLVTAPAHVELDPNDLESMKIDHVQTAVRAAIPLPHSEPATPIAKGDPQNQPAPKTAVPNAPATDKPGSSKDTPKPEGTKLAGKDAVVQAVKDCAKGHPGEVKVTISSTLRLKVGPAGEIQSAVFDPPLEPAIQSCAAAAIYKVKLDEGGALTLPIDVSY